jgi:hypothetical protein
MKWMTYGVDVSEGGSESRNWFGLVQNWSNRFLLLARV